MKLKIFFSAHSIHYQRAPPATEVLHPDSNKHKDSFLEKYWNLTKLNLLQQSHFSVCQIILEVLSSS